MNRKKDQLLPTVLPGSDATVFELEKLEAECWSVLDRAKGQKRNTTAVIAVVDELRKLYETKIKLRQQVDRALDGSPPWLGELTEG